MTTIKWFGQREETNEPDFYVYDTIPDPLRGKISFAVLDCLERVKAELQNLRDPKAWEVTYDGCRQHLSRALGRDIGDGYYSKRDLEDFLKSAHMIDLLRGIEVVLDHLLTLSALRRNASESGAIDAEEMRLEKEINKLFALYRLGYRIEVLGAPQEDEPIVQVIRVDSEFTHKEMVKPTLRLLQQEDFETAAEQFSDALAEYTDGKYADAITDVNSAFESVLKRVVNRKRGTALQLIREAQTQGYFPAYQENRIAHFAELLEALPIVRNQEGDAHGRLESGADLERFARYAVHLAAANIIFIMDEYNRRKKAQ